MSFFDFISDVASSAGGFLSDTATFVIDYSVENPGTVVAGVAIGGAAIYCAPEITEKIRDGIDYSLDNSGVVFGVLGGAALGGGAARYYAPKIASFIGERGLLGEASTGTDIEDLSGAALASASLAYLGGGSIESGGGGVALGTTVVTGVGAVGASAVGIGGVTAVNYMGNSPVSTPDTKTEVRSFTGKRSVHPLISAITAHKASLNPAPLFTDPVPRPTFLDSYSNDGEVKGL